MTTAIVVATAGCGSDDALTTRGDDPASARPAEAVEATKVTGPIELTLSADAATVAVGRRFPVSLSIRNISNEAVYWQGGGCGWPADLTVAVNGSPAGQRPPAERWDGEPDGLGEWIETHNLASLAQPLTDPTQVGATSIACTSDSRMTPLAPGDALEQRAVADIRPVPGPLPADGNAVITAGFTGYAAPEDYGGGSDNRPSVRADVSLEIALEDDPGRSDVAAAVTAFAASPALEEYLQRNRFPNVTNSWGTELVWWRDAWELRVTPLYQDRGPQLLRLRYDPAAGGVTDARVIVGGQGPDDEPDAIRHPGELPDEQLHP